MNENTEPSLNIYLIGGNSVIGKSILRGVLKKYENFSLKITSFVRSEFQEKTIGEKITVNNYLECLDHINSESSCKEVPNIYIISFGVLVEEKNSENFLNNLKYHLDINTFQSFEIFKFLLKLDKTKEIHIVSSVLGDFIRPSLYSYSFSKNLLELLISNIDLKKNLKNKYFVWKPAFVNSKLNKNRSASFIKTNPEKITNLVLNTNKSGSYYIPKYAVFFTLIAKYTTPLIKFIDKKN